MVVHGPQHFGRILDRMEVAVERVRYRLLRASRALNEAQVSYAIIGGNAVAAWVATVDVEAVRSTQDVDVLLARSSFDRARAALEAAGFYYRHAAGLDVFLDGPQGSPRGGVHIAFADELVKPGEVVPNPTVRREPNMGEFALVPLNDLVRIKLTAFRDKDRTHLRDLIGVGLVDASWLSQLRAIHPLLADRLQSLLETPDG